MRIYEVGGSVRNHYLGKDSHDRDFAVEANSYEEMRNYIADNGRIWQERPEYLTIRAKLPGLGDSDFVLCRRDGFYSDGRRPDNVVPGTIFDDLARRDFTCNAIAIETETGAVIDPHGGVADIRLGIIRLVGGVERFEEDSLRMLRAIRFSVVYGLIIEDIAWAFLQTPKNFMLLENVAPDRIREEINKMWIANPYQAFIKMQEFNSLFEYIILRRGIWMKATQEER